MAKMSKELQSIPVDCILPNKNQPRKTFDDDTLGELAASIRAVGIIQPLSVERIQDGTYTLISGERRLRAAKLAGLTHVPCVLIRAEEKDIDVMSLVENIQREDLNYVEEAKAYEKLIEKYGFTQKDLSEKVGKRQSTISNKLRILKLGHKVLAKITECGLSERHARALLNIPDTEMRLQAAETIAKKNLSVRQTEELVERLKQDVLMNSSRKNIRTSFNYRIYTNTIKQAYDAILKTGKQAEYEETRFDDRVEVKIVIPLEES